MKGRNTHLFGLIGIGVFVAIFFYQTLIYGRLPVPADTLVGLYHPWRDLYEQTNPRGVPFKNFLITDPVRQQIPWRKTSVDAWRAGHAPSWNPYNFAGTPLSANIQAAAFYPFNGLFFLFSFPVAWSILIMIQPLIAGVLLYVYLRSLRVSAVSSFFGSFIWSFSGFSIAWMTWGTMMQTAMWLPLMLMSVDVVMTTTDRSQLIRWTVLGVLGMFMTILAGHIQIALYALLVVIAYGIWRLRSYTGKVSRQEIIMRLLKVGIISLLASSVAWVPLLQFLPETVRIAAGESSRAEGWFLPWTNLVQFISPDYFGNPSTMNYWGVWNYGEFIGYIGIIPLILAISVLFLGNIASFWSVVVVVSLFFMLPHPITAIIDRVHVPLLGVLQPTRLMMVIDLGLSILAAFGLEVLLSGKNKRALRISLVPFLLLAGLWILVMTPGFWTQDAGLVERMLVSRRNLVFPSLLFVAAISLYGASVWMKKNKSIWICGILLVTAFDLFRFGWKFTPFTNSRYFFPKTKVVEFLLSQPKPFRVISLDDRILPPNVTGYYGIETIEGYDPLAPKRFSDFLVVNARNRADLSEPTGFNRIYTTHALDAPFFPYFNAQYILSLEDLASSEVKLVFSEGKTKVYQYKNALPRVYLAENIVSAENKSSEQVLDLLLSSKATRVAVVEEGVDVLSVPITAAESADITTYEPSRIVVSVRTVNPRVLVVLNSFYKHSRVSVDGKDARLLRVNYLFSGVIVPSGSHTVVLKY